MINPAAPFIQSTGFHLGLSADWLVAAASANVGRFVGHEAGAILGKPFTTLFSNEKIHDIRNRMALLRGDEAVEHLFQFRLVDDRPALDLAIYRNGNGFGIDGEPCAERSFGDSTGILQGMLSRVEPSGDVGQQCDQACHQLRALTGFQQVMISAGSRQLGQSVRAGATPIDAATAPIDPDIVIFDRDSELVPIQVVDFSWTVSRRLTLRSPSGADVALLEAIGASAALIVPLDRRGQAWGQVACYHGSPRHIGAERRGIARLFAAIMSLRIEIAELRDSA